MEFYGGREVKKLLKQPRRGEMVINRTEGSVGSSSVGAPTCLTIRSSDSQSYVDVRFVFNLKN